MSAHHLGGRASARLSVANQAGVSPPAERPAANSSNCSRFGRCRCNNFHTYSSDKTPCFSYAARNTKKDAEAHRSVSIGEFREFGFGGGELLVRLLHQMRRRLG